VPIDQFSYDNGRHDVSQRTPGPEPRILDPPLFSVLQGEGIEQGYQGTAEGTKEQVYEEEHPEMICAEEQKKGKGSSPSGKDEYLVPSSSGVSEGGPKKGEGGKDQTGQA
jgi:hypothetical protein